MILKLNKDKKDYTGLSFSLSVFLHALVFVIAAVFMNMSDNDNESGAYVQISTFESQSSDEKTISEEKNIPKETVEKSKETTAIDETADDQKKIVKETIVENKKTSEEKTIENMKGSGNSEVTFYNYSDGSADTSNLVQIYKESTLNVSVKYPAGWRYIDQNIKNKLDGVTFWTNTSTFNPPPYVHIDVQDKDLFNPKRFKYSYQTRNYTVYYNDPEELEGQFNQIIYIRTNTEEDYSLKLIMKGEEAFKMFQPVFFGMVKSFKYGTGYF
jgi:hypothetical protein